MANRMKLTVDVWVASHVVFVGQRLEKGRTRSREISIVRLVNDHSKYRFQTRID